MPLPLACSLNSGAPTPHVPDLQTLHNFVRGLRSGEEAACIELILDDNQLTNESTKCFAETLVRAPPASHEGLLHSLPV